MRKPNYKSVDISLAETNCLVSILFVNRSKKRAIQNNHNLKLFKMLGDERQTEIVFETCLISFGVTKLSFQALSIEILRSYCPVGGTRNELTLDIFLRCHLSTVENEEREKYLER